MANAIDRGLVRTSFGQIHYRTAGSGPAVLMLHINQQSSAFYLELMAAAQPFARAVAMDYPSHGMSDHIAQPALEDYARCAVELMDQLGIGEAVVLGEATGAAVAIEMAAAYPGRVRGIVLVNCPFTDAHAPRDEALAEFARFRPADETGFPVTRTIEFMLGVNPAQSPMHPTQEWMDRINRAQIEAGRDRWQALTALWDYSVKAALPRVGCPVLFLTGEHFYHRKYLPEMAALLSDPRVEILPGARFCAGWEHADAIARHLAGFVAGLPAARRGGAGRGGDRSIGEGRSHGA